MSFSASTYAMSKKYVESTADGLGAVKGAPCTIKSTEKTDNGTMVTFEWTSNSGIKQTAQIEVPDGVQGVPGPKGDKGDPGPKGEKGDAGGTSISKIEQTTTGTNNGEMNIITVTLSNGQTATFSVKNGEQGIQGPQGEKGDPFKIVKTYPTIVDMDADFDSDTVKEGQFVMISSSIEEEDNAKLYVKGASMFTFVTDLSGAQGIQGSDGVSVTSIQQTKTSPEDGGENEVTITLSNGQTSILKVRNGNKGSDATVTVDTALNPNSNNPISNRAVANEISTFPNVMNGIAMGVERRLSDAINLEKESRQQLAGTLETSLAAINTELDNKAPKASPVFIESISLGRKSDTTIGTNSVAVGNENTASGEFSCAEGMNTQALAEGAHTEGRSSKAVTRQSHSEGDCTIAGNEEINTSDASPIEDYEAGSAAHAEGIYSNARGTASHAEGYQGIATGKASHAEGKWTWATNESAHAEGSSTTASGVGSHAEGERTRAEGRYSHAEGGGCWAYRDYTHAEGCNDGDQPTIASCLGAHAEGMGTISSGNGSHSEGKGTAALREASHSEGRNTCVLGDCGHAEGESSWKLKDYIPDYNQRDLTIDEVKNAWNQGPEYEKFSVAYGRASHIEGINNLAIGKYSHVEGQKGICLSDASHVEGYGNTTGANAACAHAEGDGNTANGYTSHVEGKGNIANGAYQHVQGKYNVEDTVDSDGYGQYVHIVGWGDGIEGSPDERKNIYTLDRDGNAEFAGDIDFHSGEEKVSIASLYEIIKDLQARIAALEGNS